MATKQTKPPEGADPIQLATRAAVVPASINEADRTVDLTWSTGADVVRMDWATGERFIERLSMDPAHIRLDRLRAGAPLLDHHSGYGVRSVLGVVEAADIEDGAGVATVRFSERAEVEPVWQDVKGRILRSVSVGYGVHKWEITRATEKSLEIRTAIDWEPYEVSIVPIPADVGAQVRSYTDESTAQGAAERDENMAAKTEAPATGENAAPVAVETAERSAPIAAPAPVAAPEAPPAPTVDEVRAAERARVTEIDTLCNAHGVDAAQRSAFVSKGTELDAVRAAILDGKIKAESASHASPVTHGDGVREGKMVRSMADATLQRIGGHEIEGEGWRDFAGTDLLRMAARMLEIRGVNTGAMSVSEIAKRAISTSDFATYLDLTSHKVVRRGYESQELTHRRAFRKTTAKDFREKHSIQITDGGAMELVPEGGKIQEGAPMASKTSYKLATYGRITSFTRQMLINDDIDMFLRTLQGRGRAVAETERKVVWEDVIFANPNSDDGVAVFHAATHGNLVTSASGTTVDADTLAAARLALRKATDLKGKRIGSQLKFVICGAETETEWEKLLAGHYVPTSPAGSVAPSLRGVEVLSESAIEDEGWYGAADHNAIDTVEYAYLQGEEGPRIEQRENFETEGRDIKVAMDFGAGIPDHRGLYQHAETP